MQRLEQWRRSLASYPMHRRRKVSGTRSDKSQVKAHPVQGSDRHAFQVRASAPIAFGFLTAIVPETSTRIRASVQLQFSQRPNGGGA
jgi:hypothetical protein